MQSAGQRFENRSPIDGSLMSIVQESSTADVDRAVQATRRALKGPWGRMSPEHRVAAQIEVGIAWVNSWFLRDLRTPFGGARQSGIGREGGVHGLEFYTQLRNVCVKL